MEVRFQKNPNTNDYPIKMENFSTIFFVIITQAVIIIPVFLFFMFTKWISGPVVSFLNKKFPTKVQQKIEAVNQTQDEEPTKWGRLYIIGAKITATIVFICVWIYAIISWGFLIGVALGWFPAIIAACIAALAWPLLALLIFIVILLLITNIK